MIFTSFICTLMASFVVFSTVSSKLLKVATDVFPQKMFSEDIFNSEIVQFRIRHDR